MEIIGKLIKKLPIESGESQRGAWVRSGFVIETEGQFPKHLCFSLFGEDKIAVVRDMLIGAETKVYFSPESREYNERWYTELKCFKIGAFVPVNHPQQPQQAPTQRQQPKQPVEQYEAPEDVIDDDLPF